jgi:alpha-tubulin suppressor-like RCC1 family protein
LEITLDNQLYSWGWNEHYNLGLGHNKNINEPQLIKNDALDELITDNTHVYRFNISSKLEEPFS